MDESGDHNLRDGGDPYYPIFVLVAMIIDQSSYEEAIPRFNALKERYFGSTEVILHEHDIRKHKGVFRVLRNPDLEQKFLGEINALIDELPFTLIASIIDKRKLLKKYRYPDNPYALALEFVLERAHFALQPESEVPVILESRGRREDRELMQVFNVIRSGNGLGGTELRHFRLIFKSKQDNELGLQIADLIARPIGRAYLNPNQRNRAYSVIQKKFRRSKSGKIAGWGLKVFPSE